MKTIFNCLLCYAFFALHLFSCANNKSQISSHQAQNDSSFRAGAATKMARPFSPSDTASYAMDFDTAKGMVANYIDFARSNYGEHPYAKAFLIRSSTLQQVMLTDTSGNPGVDYIRAYIGRDQTGNFKLFLVPVKQVSSSNPAGTDSLMRGNYFKGEVKPGVPLSFGNYVWDYTLPCPTGCPTENSNSIFVE